MKTKFFIDINVEINGDIILQTSVFLLKVGLSVKFVSPISGLISERKNGGTFFPGKRPSHDESWWDINISRRIPMIDKYLTKNPDDR